jgi:hypothetical protein
VFFVVVVFVFLGEGWGIALPNKGDHDPQRACGTFRFGFVKALDFKTIRHKLKTPSLD